MAKIFSEEEINTLVETTRFKKFSFAWQAKWLITEALEASESDKYIEGLEQGKEDAEDEAMQLYNPPYEEPTFERFEFMKLKLKDAIDRGLTVAELLKEIEFESCRFI